MSILSLEVSGESIPRPSFRIYFRAQWTSRSSVPSLLQPRHCQWVRITP